MDVSVLDRARGGDEAAFRRLVDAHHAELRAHCYRMLGSLADAEDVLQETLVAAWRGLAGFEGRASLRTWLFRIATRRCLNARRDASRRVPAAPVPPFPVPEPTVRDGVPWLEPFPDALLDGVGDPAPGPHARYAARESVELAFVAALQLLPPRQAAVLLLRDVLGYDGRETADLLGTGEAAVKGLLQRARSAVRHHEPTLPTRVARAGHDAVARRFAAAYVGGDVDGVVALLTDEAWLAMPPAPHRYAGRDAVAAFLRASFGWRADRAVRLVPGGWANRGPTLGRYLGEPGAAVVGAAGLYVLTVAGERVTGITRFHGDAFFAGVGLPARVTSHD